MAARGSRHAERVAEILGSTASVAPWPLTPATLEAVDVVAGALAGDHDVRLARLALEAAVPMASAADGVEALAGLRALAGDVTDRGVALIVGCGFAPGFADVLAMHARALFDTIDEVRVARAGAAGPASIDSVREQRRDVPALFRGGLWKECARLDEQVWFPEPIGAADCQVVRGGGESLAEAFGPNVAITTSLAEAKASRWPNRDDDGLGAIRVEVWGQRGGVRDVVVYGAIDRVSIAAGAVLGRVTELLVDPAQFVAPGVHGVASAFEAAELIRSLGERGLHAAVFEGAPIG